MKSFHVIGLSILLIGMNSFQTEKDIASPVEIEAVAYSPLIPVLKGLSSNPVLRVAVSIPAGKGEQRFGKLGCTLNAAVINSIEKVDLYLTGAEPFSPTNLITSIKPSTSFDIPFSLALERGLHFLWLSIVMKDDAPIDNKIDLRCLKLIDEAGKVILVKSGNSVFAKRIGIAIRKAGDDNVNSYRIPGIVQTDKRTLIAVYDVRYKDSRDLPANIDVGMSRSTDNGKTWEPMKIIMDMGAPHENNGIGDPAVLFDPISKTIWVAALWSKGNRSIAGSEPGLSPDTTGQFILVSSDDDGRTWSQPYNITSQVKNPLWHLYFQGPGSGISMQNGNLVFASQYWDETKKPGIPHSAIIYSTDHGLTWKSGIGAKPNTTESQIVETKAGTLMLNMRDNRGSFRSVASTNDMGASWTEHSTSYNALPDPVCMGSIIKAQVNVKGIKKDVLFFSNPNTTSGRYNITIKASLDLGQTWWPANQQLIDARTCYGYSSLTKIDDNTIGILYEGTKDLYFIKVPVSEIVK